MCFKGNGKAQGRLLSLPPEPPPPPLAPVSTRYDTNPNTVKHAHFVLREATTNVSRATCS